MLSGLFFWPSRLGMRNEVLSESSLPRNLARFFNIESSARRK